ncbi:uncharacterized protein LOC131621532 [Vicia villosa]|uniref:uncharacterized protein LOC131621532 n=1 Tax=Vicia villosa TaxID=3911 RepID=UPI00273C2E24|nr:uncharacterized protein LOC131621532 [Vicia villosa]
MDSISASEQRIENNVNNKQFLPRKPARQPNPVVYRKLRRGSAAARIPEKQTELSTKELLRTIAFLTYANGTQPDKAYINDEREEWITNSEDERDEKGKQEIEMSIQKFSNHNNNDYIKKQKKKSNHIDKTKVNKECCGVSRSPSHVIYVKDTIQTSGCNQEQGLTQKFHAFCKAFIQFCLEEIICPQEDRAALAIKLYGIQAALLSALGNPFENLSQTMASRNTSQIHLVSSEKAFIGFLPAMIWSGMITLSFLYTVMVVWSLSYRVPIISMLCLCLLYCFSVLVAAASGFNVIYGTFRISGILFASLGVLTFIIVLFVLIMLVLFVCWRRTDQVVGSK